MTRSHTPEPLLTTGEVARRARLSPERIRQLDGVLRPERLANGERVYRADSVDEFVAARKEKTR